MKLAAIVNVTSATKTIDNLSAVLAASLNGVESPVNSASVGSGMTQSSCGAPLSRHSFSYCSRPAAQSR
jgi:hypothetical protein